MANGISISIEQLLTTEDWELARQAIVETNIFAAEKTAIEEEYELSDLSDLKRLLNELSADSLQSLKKKLIVTIDEKVVELRDELHQKICIEFDYCAKKEELGWRVFEYGIGGLDLLYGQGTFAFVYGLLKREILDELCNCPR